MIGATSMTKITGPQFPSTHMINLKEELPKDFWNLDEWLTQKDI